MYTAVYLYIYLEWSAKPQKKEARRGPLNVEFLCRTFVTTEEKLLLVCF